jgi:hypothetical protein
VNFGIKKVIKKGVYFVLRKLAREMLIGRKSRGRLDSDQRQDKG